MKSYFKKFVECINLEQSAELARQSIASTSADSNLSLVSVIPNTTDGVIIILEKLTEE